MAANASKRPYPITVLPRSAPAPFQKFPLSSPTAGPSISFRTLLRRIEPSLTAVEPLVVFWAMLRRLKPAVRKAEKFKVSKRKRPAKRLPRPEAPRQKLSDKQLQRLFQGTRDLLQRDGALSNCATTKGSPTKRVPRSWQFEDLDHIPSSPLTPRSEATQAQQRGAAETQLQDEAKKAEQHKAVEKTQAKPSVSATQDGSRAGAPQGENRTKKPSGLPNPGNMCYRRSAYQALLHTELFVSRLRTAADVHKAVEFHGRTNGWYEDGCILCALRNLADTLLAGQPTDAAIKNLDRIVKRACDQPWARSTAQEDAAEPLTWLIDKLNPQLGDPFEVCSRTDWSCNVCGTAHPGRAESDTHLPVAVGAGPLRACLDRLFNRDNDALVACDAGCGSNETRRRVRRLCRPAPPVLIVQLKRFQFKYDPFTQSLRPSKIDSRVALHETMDLGAYLEPSPPAAATTGAEAPRPAPRLRYRLASVVAHQGLLELGHYVTWARGEGGVWRLDDRSVTSASVAEMLDPPDGFTPYLLTYVRVDG